LALSTIGVNGLGRGTGDCGAACARAIAGANRKSKAMRPKPGSHELSFPKRKRN
jgi:hypothetical protein